jgi:hypothetical protein
MIPPDHEFLQIEAIKFGDSYSRLPAVIDVLYENPSRRLEWFGLLGQEWSGFDNLGRYRPTLRPILANASRAELDAMMTDADRVLWEALPSELIVHRGCYRHNVSGLSYSVDRRVATEFPFNIRYWHRRKQPLLVTAKVAKQHVVVISDRGESEIVTARARRQSIELLSKRVWP